MTFPTLPWSHLPHPIAVVQLATTGLLPRADRITEIAVLRMEPGQPTRWLDSRVESTGGFHGVPGFPNLVPDLRAMLDGAVMVSHNAALTSFFLEAELKRLGGRWGNPSLCTLSLARALRPTLGAHNLGAVCRHLNHPKPEPRAFPRAQAAANVLATLLSELPSDEAELWARGAVEIPPHTTEWPKIVGSLVPVGPVRTEAMAGSSLGG